MDRRIHGRPDVPKRCQGFARRKIVHRHRVPVLKGSPARVETAVAHARGSEKIDRPLKVEVRVPVAEHDLRHPGPRHAVQQPLHLNRRVALFHVVDLVRERGQQEDVCARVCVRVCGGW